MWIDDEILLQAAKPRAMALWIPAQPLVVLGSSNAADAEADVAACHRDGVAILKRYGGGGTVVLHSGCVVISVGLWVRQHFQNRFYFERLNQSMIEALARTWPALGSLGQRGLSDITANDRKVCGTSLFRSRNYLLYQASLLIDARVELFETYLRHPTREPDYRQGRGHRSFVAGLVELVDGITPLAVRTAFQRDLDDVISLKLEGELIQAQADQTAGLLKRAQAPEEPLQ